MADLTVAFVTPPDGNVFMAEIFGAVADAVSAHGVSTVLHQGEIADVDDGMTAFVIIPHEYMLLSPRPTKQLLRRTIAFGVDHPGTGSFELSVRASALAAARFEISEDATLEMRARGYATERFALGYSERWDSWRRDPSPRPVDLTYLGSAEPDRLRVLASLAKDLAMLETELLVPPFEPMRGARPDFLVGAAKWSLLSQSKLLLNLHRESKTAFEWVRCLEAMCNGCVVLTEPSTDLAPLVAGEHLLIAPRAELGTIAREAVHDPEMLRALADAAYDICRETLSMDAPAAKLAEVADELVNPTSARRVPPPLGIGVSQLRKLPQAGWLAAPYELPHVVLNDPMRDSIRGIAAQRRRLMAIEAEVVAPARPATVDLICVQHRASGRVGATLTSIADIQVAMNAHVCGLDVPESWAPAGVQTALRCNIATSIGAARNQLLRRSDARYVLIMDAGDELFPGALEMMLDVLDQNADATVAVPMAAYGRVSLTNAIFPEPARLARSPYMTRGYLVRRSWLEGVALYADDPVLEAFVDYDFWLRTAQDPNRIAHLHRIGMRLWETNTKRFVAIDPQELRAQIRARHVDNTALAA